MPLLTVTGAHLAFGHVPLLDNVEFSIDAGERVALIGRNGTGKSSLLKAIAGQIALDDGLIARQTGTAVAYVPQEPAFEPGHTVFEATAAGLAEHAARLAEYDAVVTRLADAALPAADHDALLARMQQLQSELEDTGGWALHGRVERVLTRLGLDAHARVDALSGGTQKRVALARALVAEPDLLLLDEPTNHLDIDSIVWLEDLLRAHRGAVLLITHDRRFLDRVATRIVELDRGILRSYPGSFAAYEARKEQELAAEQIAHANLDKLLAQEEAWIRQGVEARRTRAVGRVRRLEALRRARAARRERAGDVKLAVSEGERSGRLVAELIDVSKSWGGRPVVREFSTIIQRGDRVGLIGPNGAGKTTLLKLILGEIAPDAGRVRRGTHLTVAYFDQMRAQLDPEATLVDTISPGSEWVEIGGKRTHVMSYLSDFLFAPERSRSPVRTLSGGERNRLLLARLFARPANVLVMDEPTNDLDIDTLELLEQLLADYAGTLLLVSHDRAFLDNVVTQTIAAEDDGLWREHVGGYADYEAARERAAPPGRAGAADAGASSSAGGATAARSRTAVPSGSAAGVASPETASPDVASQETAPAAAAAAGTPASAPAGASPSSPAAPAAARRAKLSYKEQRELDALPARIAALEAEQKALAAQLADPAGYQSDAQRMAALHVRHAQIDDELLGCLERWEALEATGGRPT